MGFFFIKCIYIFQKQCVNMVNLSITLGFFALSFLYLIISQIFEKKHYILKTYFIFVCLLSIMINSSMLIELTETEVVYSDIGSLAELHYILITITFAIISFYFLGGFTYNLFASKIKTGKQRKR